MQRGLIGIIAILLLQNTSLVAINRDVTQIEISIFVQEQANAFSCSFNWLTFNKLRVDAERNRSCAFKYHEMKHNAEKYVLSSAVKKTYRININHIVRLEVTVQ